VGMHLVKVKFCVLQVKPPPSGLVGRLSDLFIQQEKARCQLRMQHIKERVKTASFDSFYTLTHNAPGLLYSRTLLFVFGHKLQTVSTEKIAVIHIIFSI